MRKKTDTPELLDVLESSSTTQTDLENTVAAAADTQEIPASQTDFEVEISGESVGEGTSPPQTDPDDADDLVLNPGIQEDEMPSGDTGLENTPEDYADRESDNSKSASVQTDSEQAQDDPGEPAKPKTKRAAARPIKKAAKAAASSEKATAGTQIRTKKNAFLSESGEGELEESSTAVTKPATRRSNSTTQSSARRANRNTGPAIVSIDTERSVESDADKMHSALLDLVESMKGRKILSGTIQGVERSEENPDLSFAVVYHGDFKVIIPAEEAVEPPNDFRGRDPGDVMHYLLTKRLGAEVDYIVKGADPETEIAAASRLEAMVRKRKEYYFGTDREGYNLMYEGIIAEARVISVIRAGVFVEVFGAECYIPLRELSYQRWLDAATHFQPGQRVLVKMLSINREDRNNIRVSASVKQAGENPYEKALRRYTVGNRYVGSVSMVDTNGVFVSLDGGIDCLCSYPKRGRPPRGSRVTVRILGINKESNRIWGAITHMTTAR